jgi:hypothetical protein
VYELCVQYVNEKCLTKMCTREKCTCEVFVCFVCVQGSPEAYLNPDMLHPYTHPLERAEKQFTCPLSVKEKMLNIDTLGLYYKKRCGFIMDGFRGKLVEVTGNRKETGLLQNLFICCQLGISMFHSPRPKFQWSKTFFTGPRLSISKFLSLVSFNKLA